MRPLWFGCLPINDSVATTMAARLDFMSAAPRPNKKPSRSVGTNGSLSQCSRGPGGTTSVCPANTRSGPSLPRVAHRLRTSSACKHSQVNPILASRSAMSGWHPSSAGVTDCFSISSRVRAMASLYELVVCMKAFVEFYGGLVREAFYSP